jgi:hypothetical protein
VSPWWCKGHIGKARTRSDLPSVLGRTDCPGHVLVRIWRTGVQEVAQPLPQMLHRRGEGTLSPACKSILFSSCLGDGRYFLLRLCRALLLGPLLMWHIVIGCRRPEVGSMLPLVVLDQRMPSLACEDRPLAPASGLGRWRVGDSNMTTPPMLPARGCHSILMQ